jgi:hypothetical protein
VEIATVTGHWLRSLRAILDTHALALIPRLAAIRKLACDARSKTGDALKHQMAALLGHISNFVHCAESRNSDDF